MPSIDSEALRTFARRTALLHRPRLLKLLTAPLRMASSACRLAWCRARGKPLATRARTFWGQDMRVMYPEVVSIALGRYGFIEEGLTSMLLTLLKPGMTFVDVGGHYGYFSLLAGTLVGPRGQVHTFEPAPTTFDVLRQNTARLPHVQLNNLALAAEEGELTFRDYGVEFAAYNTLATGHLEDHVRQRLQPREITVRTRRLDDYLRETSARPDFVKIDAEGAELQILKGMTHTMAIAKPMITIEVAMDPRETPGASANTVRFLEEHGYVAHEWADGRIRRHEPRPNYQYDNLLFVHRDAAAPAVA